VRNEPDVSRRGQIRRAVCLVFLAALVGACTGATTPRIEAVSPQQISLGTAALLLVSGSGFEKGDTVWVGNVALTSTVWVNSSLLTAALGSDMPADTYDVAVKTSAGRRTFKAGALLVGVGAGNLARQTPTPSAGRTPTLTPSPTRSPSPTASPTPTPSPTPTTPAQPGLPAAFDVSGHWSVIDTVQDNPRQPLGIFLGDVALVQAGDQVAGSGEHLVSLEGTLSGSTLIANYVGTDGSSGQFVWTFAPDDKSFSGSFTIGSSSHGLSHGTLSQRGP